MVATFCEHYEDREALNTVEKRFKAPLKLKPRNLRLGGLRIIRTFTVRSFTVSLHVRYLTVLATNTLSLPDIFAFWHNYSHPDLGKDTGMIS